MGGAFIYFLLVTGIVGVLSLWLLTWFDYVLWIMFFWVCFILWCLQIRMGGISYCCLVFLWLLGLCFPSLVGLAEFFWI